MPVLEQDKTMYEMSTSWSRSLVPFHSLSFTLSLTQASLPQQTSPDLNAREGHKSHNPLLQHAVTIEKCLQFLTTCIFRRYNEGLI